MCAARWRSLAIGACYLALAMPQSPCHARLNCVMGGNWCMPWYGPCPASVERGGRAGALPWDAGAAVEGGCDLNLESLDDRSASCLYVQIVVDSGGTNPLGWYIGIPKLKTCSSGTE